MENKMVDAEKLKHHLLKLTLRFDKVDRYYYLPLNVIFDTIDYLAKQEGEKND